jgi:hypothetical protein
MIISRDTSPEKDLYYLGGKVLGCLERVKQDNIDYFSLFDSVKKEVDISSNLFSLCLSWLYLLGSIELTEQGDIRKCF